MLPKNNKTKAFTLIEILVIILIIALLIAVAVPSFLGQQNKAHDSKTQQELSIIRKNIKTFWVEKEKYPALGATTDTSSADTNATIISQIKNSEPQYPIAAQTLDGAPYSTGTTTIYADNNLNPNMLTACQQSKSGRTFCLLTDETVNSSIGQQTTFQNQTLAANNTYYSSAPTEQEARCYIRKNYFKNNQDKPISGISSDTCNATNATGQWTTGEGSKEPTKPANITPPTINGLTTVGNSLTYQPGVWEGNPTLTHEWLKCDNNGTNCTKTNNTNTLYELNTTDINYTFKIEETATNNIGTEKITVGPTQPIKALPTIITLPTINGTTTEGYNLTTTDGTWNNNPTPPFQYQWLRCTDNTTETSCTNITGATNASYTLTAADTGKYIRSKITATNPQGTGTATSSPTSQIAAFNYNQTVSLNSAGLTQWLDNNYNNNNNTAFGERINSPGGLAAGAYIQTYLYDSANMIYYCNGYTNNIIKSYLIFDSLPTIPPGMKLTGATLSLRGSPTQITINGYGQVNTTASVITGGSLANSWTINNLTGQQVNDGALAFSNIGKLTNNAGGFSVLNILSTINNWYSNTPYKQAIVLSVDDRPSGMQCNPSGANLLYQYQGHYNNSYIPTYRPHIDLTFAPK